MAKYKVAVLRVQGINKITYKAGDIVTDKNFPEGITTELVKGGFLVEYAEPAPAESEENNTGKVAESIKPAPVKSEGNKKGKVAEPAPAESEESEKENKTQNSD